MNKHKQCILTKVEVDIPIGEYRIVSISSSSAYVEVSSNALHKLGGIVSNDNFDSERYIIVYEGQYLKLSRCKLVQ
ncbi:MAG: hypothetical protein ACK5LC_07740 [Coprobacillaceae bacterium]